jgi:hypothetical protein
MIKGGGKRIISERVVVTGKMPIGQVIDKNGRKNNN